MKWNIYLNRTIKVGKIHSDLFLSSCKAFLSAVNDSANLVSSSDDLSVVFSSGNTELLLVEWRRPGGERLGGERLSPDVPALPAVESLALC